MPEIELPFLVSIPCEQPLIGVTTSYQKPNVSCCPDYLFLQAAGVWTQQLLFAQLVQLGRVMCQLFYPTWRINRSLSWKNMIVKSAIVFWRRSVNMQGKN